jgi:hypothetical protein
MNIIKEGNPNYKLCEQKRFKCDFCDCEWEADRGEYFSCVSPASCVCPNCRAIVYELGSYKRSEAPPPPINDELPILN